MADLAVPPQVSSLLHDLAIRLPVILGKNLTGIYLYGSLTQRAFIPERSDIDCIVVTRRDLSDSQFKRIDALLARHLKTNPWAARLQMSFLIKDEVLTMDSRACLFQLGVFQRCGSDGNPIIWMNVLQSGIVLCGPPPQSFVPTITREILFQALAREVGYLREEIILKPQSEWRDLDSYRAYAVLTLCRILYSHGKGTIVSKKRAARWAITRLPGQLAEIVRQALASDAGKLTTSIPRARIEQFISYVEAKIHCGPNGPTEV